MGNINFKDCCNIKSNSDIEQQYGVEDTDEDINRDEEIILKNIINYDDEDIKRLKYNIHKTSPGPPIFI